MKKLKAIPCDERHSAVKIACHIGPHCTNEGALLRSLLKNARTLQVKGIEVPKPSRYRRLVNDALKMMNSGELAEDAGEVLLDAILENDDVDRVVLSNFNFICIAKHAMNEKGLYTSAAVKCSRFERLFKHDEVEFFISVRNPATFLPALYNLVADRSPEQLLCGNDPFSLRWSTVVSSIRQACQTSQVTVWTHEDAPLLWEQIIHEIADMTPDGSLDGGLELVKELMTKTGFRRMKGYLDKNKELSNLQKRRVVAAFLDKYETPPDEKGLLNFLGWKPEQVTGITERYIEDLDVIRSIEGVTLIEP